MMIKKQNNQERSSWYKKLTRKLPTRIQGVLFLFLCVLFAFLQMVTQMSCMDTLLPICIPWMYYQYAVLGVFLIPFLINPIKKYIRKSSNKRKPVREDYVWKIVVVLIVVPAFIFLPNRYISICPKKEYFGNVIEQTTASVNKSPSSDRIYVKIELEGENLSFWRDLKKESQPIGAKCIVSVREGIFGMRCVEEVRFLVE